MNKIKESLNLIYYNLVNSNIVDQSIINNIISISNKILNIDIISVMEENYNDTELTELVNLYNRVRSLSITIDQSMARDSKKIGEIKKKIENYPIKIKSKNILLNSKLLSLNEVDYIKQTISFIDDCIKNNDLFLVNKIYFLELHHIISGFLFFNLGMFNEYSRISFRTNLCSNIKFFKNNYEHNVNNFTILSNNLENIIQNIVNISDLDTKELISYSNQSILNKLKYIFRDDYNNYLYPFHKYGLNNDYYVTYDIGENIKVYIKNHYKENLNLLNKLFNKISLF